MYTGAPCRRGETDNVAEHGGVYRFTIERGTGGTQTEFSYLAAFLSCPGWWHSGARLSDTCT